MEGRDKKVLSICISTYNRCNECIRLVEKIFTLDDSRYNVVVCDDASSDGTSWKLRKLPYKNLIVKENKKTWDRAGTGTGRLTAAMRNTYCMFWTGIRWMFHDCGT